MTPAQALPKTRTSRITTWILLGMLILLSLLLPQPALADIAPPEKPPGVNVVPGDENTWVRMLSENVLIDVLPNPPAGSLGQARVTARFVMRNLGDSDEKLAVRFPLTFLGGRDDGFGRYPEIKDFSARVNGRNALARRVTARDPAGIDKNMPWAEFEATFPAGEEVLIDVSYLADGMGEYPFVSFKYILETGSGWRDTIGEADLAVRLPYEANNQNVIFDEQIGWSQTTPGSQIDGREIRWKFTDLEPRKADNLEISLVMPGVWKKVLEERARVTRSPVDGEAWGRLGKLYKEIVSYRRGLRQDPGGKELYQLGVAAYEKALELLPKDALWHAGFAELLYRNYYWHQSFRRHPDHSEMLRALDELRLSIELDADNAKALELLDDIKYALPEALRQDGEEFVFLWLTATPTARPTDPEPTSSPVPASPTPDLDQSLPTTTASPTASPASPGTPDQTATASSAGERDESSEASQTPSQIEAGAPASTPESRGGGLSVCGVGIGMLVVVFTAGWLRLGSRQKSRNSTPDRF